MFYLALTQVVQRFRPIAELAQDLRHGTRNEDVARISTIHHPLGDVDSAARYVPVGVDIFDPVDGTAVHSHPDLEGGKMPQSAVYFARAADRSHRIAQVDQRHSAASRRTQLL